jgi:hypothetical protein
MKSYLICLSVLMAGLSGAVTWADDDGKEEKVAVEQLPSLVKATLLKEVGSGTIVDLVRQTKGSTVTYEADFKLNGATWELRIAEDGKVVSKQLEDDDDDDDDDDDEDDDGPDDD